jgi:3-oxoacyl-[acyl-carrier protein] reductase
MAPLHEIERDSAGPPVDSTGRVVLITGGAGGLGLASAQRLARDGLTVALTDLDQNAAQQAAASLPGEGHIGVAMDVSAENSVASVFELVEGQLGPIGVLATFAGSLGTRPDGSQPVLAETTLELWNRTFAINATGTFLCLREFARYRTARRVQHGRVVTVSSAGAYLGGYQAKASYCASKGAVVSLTKAAARDLASLGITVNSIAPGPIDTPMLRAARGPTAPTGDGGYNVMSLLLAGRVGRPEEVAAAVSYLVSVDGGFVTGSTLAINGGLHML